MADIALRAILEGPVQAVKAAAGGITLRAYVDDVKFFARQDDPTAAAQAVADAIQVWETSAAEFGAVLSRSKCALAGNSPEVRKQLKIATAGEGIQLVAETRDLGAPTTGGGGPDAQQRPAKERTKPPTGLGG